jgi:hypothetical protein
VSKHKEFAVTPALGIVESSRDHLRATLIALSSNGSFSPEKRLLVCCARTRIQPPIAEEICALAGRALDWEFLFCEAAENSVTPLLGRQLPALAAGIVPPEQLSRLKNLTRANAVRSLVLTAELLMILKLFRSEGIEAIPYKGPVLAAQAYGDVTLREFEDLDIVLRQRDMAKANDLMMTLGYRPKFPWILSSGAKASRVPGEYNYRDGPRRMMVELHTERTLRHFPVPPDLDDLSRRLVLVSLSGHEVLTFGPEDGLPILCIHGAKDFWERMSWIADIAEFVQAHPQLDWDHVFMRAEVLHAGRMLHVGLALAISFLDASLPDEIVARVGRDRVAGSIAYEVQQRLLSRKWPSMDAAGRFRFRRRMMKGSLAGWGYAARLTIVPSEDDWSTMSLPGWLVPLYIALRPLRLLRKYGLGGDRPSRPPS